MYTFYLIALIPAILGLFLFLYSKKISWIEWAAASVAGLLCSLIIHGIAIHGMTADQETWSGQFVKAIHEPEWIEEYQQRHTKEVTVGHDKDGNAITETKVWYTTEHRKHHEDWTAYADFGSGVENSYSIDAAKFKEIADNFGGIIVETPYKDGFDSGDPNIYVAYNKTGYIYPTTILRNFENKLKAAPTLMSYAPVPKDAPVYDYPANNNPFQSDRLVGIAYKHFDINLLDKMNSRIGPKRLINVILVEFGSDKSMHIAKQQEAKWVGGKKNDLVICYSLNANKKTQWAYCFGWSDANLIKRNMETLFMSNLANNDLLVKIEEEVNKNWRKRSWHEFDYITIRPAPVYYVTLIIIMIIVQGIVWGISFFNGFDRDSKISTHPYRRRKSACWQ